MENEIVQGKAPKIQLTELTLALTSGEKYMLGGDPFNASRSMSPEEMCALADSFKHLALFDSSLDKHSQRKALWQSRALELVAFLIFLKGEIKTIGEGYVAGIETLDHLKKVISRSTPMPSLFPEKDDIKKIPITGDFYFVPPDEMPWVEVIECGKVPFLIYPDGEMLISTWPNRHLALSGGCDVFAAGILVPHQNSGGLFPLLKSFDYAIPTGRQRYVVKMLELLGNPIKTEDTEVINHSLISKS